MKVNPLKTKKIRPGEDDLFAILDRYVKHMPEASILAVTSKIVSLCEGRVVKAESANKDEIIKNEADVYIPKKLSKYNLIFTIKNSMLIASAGVDESNTGGYYVLWPEDPQASANAIRTYLAKRFGLKKVGVIITDSKTTPLRWGTTGFAIAQSGFRVLNSYIGKPDLFGRKLKMTKANVAEGLAASAVVAMGEGAEQTPLAVIEDVPFVQFQSRNPSKKEIADLKIAIQDDLYAPLLNAVKWRKGKR